MGRAIKFRAWSASLKLMQEPFSLTDDRGMLGKLGEIHLESYEIMQYTGLKDKNGVEIFEGDILLYVTPPEHFDGSPDTDKYLVEWKQAGFEATWIRPSSSNFTSDGHLSIQGVDQDMRVIGNIYENPELLTA